MNLMAITSGKLVAWFVTGACVVANSWFFVVSIGIPKISCSNGVLFCLLENLAFLYIFVTYGIPIVTIFIVSAVTCAVTFYMREKSKVLASMLNYNYGIGLVAFVNLLISTFSMYWFLEAWRLD